MFITTETIREKTSGDGDIIDLTDKINSIIDTHKIQNGQTNIFSVGSTTAITHIEFEPGLKKDLPTILNELIPYSRGWEHHKTWGDHNGAAHLKSAIIGPSLTIPIQDGKLMLGTWQQIVFLEFDDRPRDRKIVIQIIGD